jgi:hypothetical protein
MAKEEKKEETIDFSDRVTIEATVKSKYMTLGKTYEVHPILAKKLIAKGRAKKVTSPAAKEGNK